MANLRAVYDNALGRNSSLIASPPMGSLVLTNILSDTKSAVYRTQANVTVNPDFESGSTGWTLFGGAAIVSDGNTHAGNYSAKYVSASSTNAIAGRSNYTPAAPGDSFSLSGWGKCLSGFTGAFDLRIRFYDAAFSPVGSDTTLTFTTATSFNYVSASSTAPAGTAWVGVLLYSRGVGTMYWDDVALCEGSIAFASTQSVQTTVRVAWASPETISCVAIPFNNLTNAALIRVRTYSDEAGSLLLSDSGWAVACPGGIRGDALWANIPQGVNSFAYGGGSYALVWLPRASGIQHVQISLSDTTNPDGYIEFANLVVGDYWEADYNVGYGDVNVMTQETTKDERSDAGDLRIDRGVMCRDLSLSLKVLSANDKARLWRILRGNGMSTSVFVSVVPTSTDANEIQMHMIYGKLSKQSAIMYQTYNLYASSLDIQEV